MTATINAIRNEERDGTHARQRLQSISTGSSESYLGLKDAKSPKAAIMETPFESAMETPASIFKRILGWILLLVGIPFYFLPIPIGLIMILFGLALLGKHSPFVRCRLRLIERFSPGLYQRLCKTIGLNENAPQ